MDVCKNREGNLVFIFEPDEEYACQQMIEHAKKRGNVNFAKIYTYDDEMFLEFHYYEAHIAILMIEYLVECVKPDTENGDGIKYQASRTIAMIMDWAKEKRSELQ